MSWRYQTLYNLPDKEVGSVPLLSVHLTPFSKLRLLDFRCQILPSQFCCFCVSQRPFCNIFVPYSSYTGNRVSQKKYSCLKYHQNSITWLIFKFLVQQVHQRQIIFQLIVDLVIGFTSIKLGSVQGCLLSKNTAKSTDDNKITIFFISCLNLDHPIKCCVTSKIPT